MTARVLFAMTGCERVPGGIASLNRNILAALGSLASRGKGIRLFVFSLLEDQSARPGMLPEGAEFRGFSSSRGEFAVKLLAAGARGGVYIFDHVTLALPVLPLAMTGRIRTVIFAHGSEAWRRIRRTSRWSFGSAELCLTNSAYTLERMRARIGEFRGRACPLGLSPEFELADEIPDPAKNCVRLEAADGVARFLNGRVLLLVGRLHRNERRKGHYPLIRILPELRRNFPDVQLVFPGPGNDRASLIEYAQVRGVADAVFVPGYQSLDQLKKLYSTCYAYVMPSKQEGFGLTYLEAMSYGKPCIGCCDDGAEEVIRHGETGYLVEDPEVDTGELLAALRRLLSAPDLARRMGEVGFQRLHDRFTADHVQRRILTALEQVLAC